MLDSGCPDTPLATPPLIALVVDGDSAIFDEDSLPNGTLVDSTTVVFENPVLIFSLKSNVVSSPLFSEDPDFRVVVVPIFPTCGRGVSFWVLDSLLIGRPPFPDVMLPKGSPTPLGGAGFSGAGAGFSGAGWVGLPVSGFFFSGYAAPWLATLVCVSGFTLG